MSFLKPQFPFRYGVIELRPDVFVSLVTTADGDVVQTAVFPNRDFAELANEFVQDVIAAIHIIGIATVAHGVNIREATKPEVLSDLRAQIDELEKNMLAMQAAEKNKLT